MVMAVGVQWLAHLTHDLKEQGSYSAASIGLESFDKYQNVKIYFSMTNDGELQGCRGVEISKWFVR